jgi:hypothetical protein
MYSKFTIKERLDNRGRIELLGQLSSRQCREQQWIEDRWLGYLQHQERIFYGRRHKAGDLWRFTFEQGYEEVKLQPGRELIAYDGYWGERVELVLNKEIEWQEAQFKVRGEWDHDHCAICWATISEEVNREHRLGGGKDAVCLSCFENYIRRKDIGFITCV